MGQIKIRFRSHYKVTLKYRRKLRSFFRKEFVSKETIEAFGDTPMGVLLNAINGCGQNKKDVAGVTNVMQIHEYPAVIILDIQP